MKPLARRVAAEGRQLRDAAWMGRRIIQKLIVTALPIPLHLAMSALLHSIYWRFGSVPAHVRQNVIVFFNEGRGSSQAERIAREYHAFSKEEYLWRILPRHPGFRASERFPVSGLEHLHDAKRDNRAVILVTAHLGYPHIIPHVLEKHGFSIRQVIAERDRPARNRRVEAWLEQAGRLKRAIYRNTVVVTDILGPSDIVASLDVRPLMAALANGEVVMIAGDGLRSTQFIKLPLLGKPYPFPTGLMKIARMTGAVVLPTFAVPATNPKGIRVDIHPPLGIVDGDLEEELLNFANVLDCQLRRTPHLWLRWKTPDWYTHALRRAEEKSF